MDPETTALILGIVNAVQIILLAVINNRQTRMVRKINGHLESHADEAYRAGVEDSV